MDSLKLSEVKQLDPNLIVSNKASFLFSWFHGLPVRRGWIFQVLKVPISGIGSHTHFRAKVQKTPLWLQDPSYAGQLLGHSELSGAGLEWGQAGSNVPDHWARVTHMEPELLREGLEMSAASQGIWMSRHLVVHLSKDRWPLWKTYQQQRWTQITKVAPWIDGEWVCGNRVVREDPNSATHCLLLTTSYSLSCTCFALICGTEHEGDHKQHNMSKSPRGELPQRRVFSPSLLGLCGSASWWWGTMQKRVSDLEQSTKLPTSFLGWSFAFFWLALRSCFPKASSVSWYW